MALNYNRASPDNCAVSACVHERPSCKRPVAVSSAFFGPFSMYLPLLWLALCSLLISAQLQAAAPPSAPTTLSSQLRIDREDLGFAEKD